MKINYEKPYKKYKFIERDKNEDLWIWGFRIKDLMVVGIYLIIVLIIVKILGLY